MLLLGAPSPARAADGAITIGLQLEPPNLDPTSGAAAAIDEVVYANVLEGLVRLAADGSVRPLLAQGWQVSPDGRTYTFALRPGVRFHDGHILTAADVAFSLNRARAPGSSNAQAQAFGTIARVDVIDPLRVRVTLRAPDSGFLTLLSFGDAVIVSPRSAASLATAPVGTGPFRFNGWRRGDSLTLARNPAYWGRPASLAKVTYRFIADPTAAYAAMRSGDVTIFPDFPAPETLAQLRSDPRLRIVTAPSQGEVILAMNERAGPLADVRVRRAISQAIDRRAIIDGAMFGYGTPIGSHFPPQSPDYVDLTGRYPFDRAAAKRLLAEAGYPHGFTLTLKLPPPSYARRSGELIAAQLRAVGIAVRVESVEWAQWLDQVLARHAFDLTIVAHAEPFDYDIYGREDYYFGYDGRAVRVLLSRLRATTDPAARHELLGAIQRRIADDAANAFLFQFPHLGVQDVRLRDAWINTPNQTLDLAAARFDGGESGAAVAAAGTGHAGLGWLLAAAVVLAAVAGLGVRTVLRRAGVLAATMLAATVVIFVLVQIVPGDPAAYMMGLNASPRAIAALHAELGFGGSAPLRYARWMAELVRGDFGTSYTYRVPVAGLLAERLAVSLPLALLATLLSVAIGVPAGYLAARRRGGWTDVAFSWAARLGIAVPSFWLALVLLLVFAVRLHWVPAGGFPGWSSPGAALAALVLPLVALAVPQAAILARVTRGALLAAMEQDYLRTARAKGLSRDATLWRHALPNALGPAVTVLGLQVPFLLAGSAIIENVFFLPGLGRLVLQAVAQRDLVVVQAVVVLLVGMTVLASFLADLAAAWLDPRLRA
ncbi:ABC transporter permease subunit [Sphingomonas aracearum]|uniref:ABC transporter permease subunit n=2 Tax=Sphingomonas aracearum TaxID=2283317 RepID=A0A369VSA8_9SPHN|nr:ABC transporter permease subunit [Sphingomonas aracearum]